MERKTLKRWLIVAGLLYLVFPRDLIPDYLGRGFGLADDFLLIAFLAYLYRRRAGRWGDPSDGRREDPDHQRRSREEPVTQIPFDPYAILGIESSATVKEIRDAYRARMREYHPDKVAHLGEELQQVAHRKSIEIQRAYEALRK